MARSPSSLEANLRPLTSFLTALNLLTPARGDTSPVSTNLVHCSRYCTRLSRLGIETPENPEIELKDEAHKYWENHRVLVCDSSEN